MDKFDRYGMSDLIVPFNTELPKYVTITDSKGTTHEIEIYFIATEDENENEV
tara:strand:- start:584 stop:739 length:156 start_codon:yes stop_codon:yes gene_type:complete